ncbi:hypothetical protein B0G80_1317 [Paraburkholderia sp. BL6669N2]|nr:hypothetical protein B0G80_1317 [Paraburkholderia sp. BL6669N2]
MTVPQLQIHRVLHSKNMLKQLHPHVGGLRWLGVLYVSSIRQRCWSDRQTAWQHDVIKYIEK